MHGIAIDDDRAGEGGEYRVGGVGRGRRGVLKLGGATNQKPQYRRDRHN